eukprot:TRINITY_DN1774_c0_g1_i9.p1 TRINITY_DN1774_c0_g1~~TRINITY_DN1774_c0_g1_i9.p1  ORF type:complete len:118 (+),score=1.14 TRINITY_DN1774_c0_g1_i9:97-450(+)
MPSTSSTSPKRMKMPQPMRVRLRPKRSARYPAKKDVNMQGKLYTDISSVYFAVDTPMYYSCHSQTYILQLILNRNRVLAGKYSTLCKISTACTLRYCLEPARSREGACWRFRELRPW